MSQENQESIIRQLEALVGGNFSKSFSEDFAKFRTEWEALAKSHQILAAHGTRFNTVALPLMYMSGDDADEALKEVAAELYVALYGMANAAEDFLSKMETVLTNLHPRFTPADAREVVDFIVTESEAHYAKAGVAKTRDEILTTLGIADLVTDRETVAA